MKNQTAHAVLFFCFHAFAQAELGSAYKQKNPASWVFHLVAEGGGFEPPEQFPVRQFSKLVVSATHPSLQRDCKYSILFFIISSKSTSFNEN